MKEESKKGMSLLEVILAVGLFFVISTGFYYAFLGILSLKQSNEDQVLADQFAREGYELVRSLRKQGFENINRVENGGVEWSADQLQTHDGTDSFRNFTREITVRFADRNGDGDVVEKGDGSPDQKTLEVISVVTWRSSSGEELSTSYTGYLMFWEELF